MEVTQGSTVATIDRPPPVHLVIGMSAAGSLRQALDELGIDEEIVGFPDDLSFGPINPPDLASRNGWVEEFLFRDDFDDYGERADRCWDRILGPSVSPVVWVCRRCAREYAGFLEFIWRIGDRPFRLVDITDVAFASTPGSERPARVAATFGIVPSDAIIAADLLGRQAAPTAEWIAFHRNAWGILRDENAALRVVTDDGLRSAPLTHFDQAILDRVTAEREGGGAILHDVWHHLLADNFHQCGDVLLWARVRALANAGVLELRGDADYAQGSDVRHRS